MDGAVQTVYPRKNWSLMALYNCDHPKNELLTPGSTILNLGSSLTTLRLEMWSIYRISLASLMM